MKLRLQEKRNELNIEQLELARNVKTNAPMMSNFEHYKCLPVPEMLKAICRELKCEVWEIYDYDEIFVDTRKIHKQLKVDDGQEPQIYKLTVELPNSTRKVLTQTNLEKCGYQSLKDFVWHCFKRFEKQLAILNSKEKTTQLTTAKVVEQDNTIAPYHQ